jgi:hypothetical protein
VTGGRICATAAAAVCVLALAGCGGGRGPVDSGGFTAGDREDAQAALDALRDSNIPRTLISLTGKSWKAPTTCRVHLAAGDPKRFHVYIFWVPYFGQQSYIWLNMTLAQDATKDRFHLGTEAPVLPGGIVLPGGKGIAPGSLDYDAPLSGYGPEQVRKNKEAIAAHAGDAFAKPGGNCQVLANGYLRLLPNT